MLSAVLVVLPFVFEWQLVAQCGGQGEQAGSAGAGGQGGLQASRVGRQGHGDGMTVGEVLSLELLSDDGVEFSHGDLLGSLHCLHHLLLMLLREEGDDLGAYRIQALDDLRLFVHLNVEPVRHFIVHDIVSLHLRLLTGQLLTLQLETVVLGLQKLKLLLDAVTRLCDSEFERLTRLVRDRMPRRGVHLTQISNH